MIRSIRVIRGQIRKEEYEVYCNCSGVRNEIGGVDKELSEAVVEDWGEYYLGKNAG